MRRRRAGRRSSDAWSKRQSWPYGAPLERVASALSAVVGPPDDAWTERDRPDPEDGWFSLFKPLGAVEWEEHDIAFDAGAAGLDLDAERAALEAAGDDVEEQDWEILALFVDRNERSGAADFTLGQVDAPGFRDLSVEAQIDAVRQAFGAAAERRRRAVERVIDGLAVAADDAAAPPGGPPVGA